MVVVVGSDPRTGVNLLMIILFFPTNVSTPLE